MPWDRSHLVRVRAVVAELYPREVEQRRVVAEAGLRQAAIAFDAGADNSWFNILAYAEKQHRVDAIMEIVLAENPDNELLARAQEESPPGLLRGPDFKSGIAWHAPVNTRALQEKVLGAASTLVPVSFLAVGLARARAVARIKLADGSLGTGFLTDENLLVTNNHVLPSAAAACEAVAQFNYQKTTSGLDEPIDELGFVPAEGFVTSIDDDFTIVRVAGAPNAKWGALAVRPAVIGVGDRVNIIQHPGGDQKQLSFFANVVVHVGAGRIQYLTDTMPGSSGAPVFDRAWNLVGLHHSGGWLAEPGGDPKQTFFRNQGVAIDAVVAGLARVSR